MIQLDVSAGTVEKAIAFLGEAADEGIGDQGGVREVAVLLSIHLTSFPCTRVTLAGIPALP